MLVISGGASKFLFLIDLGKTLSAKPPIAGAALGS